MSQDEWLLFKWVSIILRLNLPQHGVLVTPFCVHMFMHVSMKIDLYLSTADRYQGPQYNIRCHKFDRRESGK